MNLNEFYSFIILTSWFFLFQNVPTEKIQKLVKMILANLKEIGDPKLLNGDLNFLFGPIDYSVWEEKWENEEEKRKKEERKKEEEERKKEEKEKRKNEKEQWNDKKGDLKVLKKCCAPDCDKAVSGSYVGNSGYCRKHQGRYTC